jgi:hypothetical protein
MIRIKNNFFTKSQTNYRNKCFKTQVIDKNVYKLLQKRKGLERVANNEDKPNSVKLNRGGSSSLFGNRVPGSLSSSKKGWAQAWSGVIREQGVYSKSLETNSIASAGIRLRKT